MRDRWTRGRYGRFERTTDSHLPSDAACRSCPHVIVTRVHRLGNWVGSLTVAPGSWLLDSPKACGRGEPRVHCPAANKASQTEEALTRNTSHS